MYEAANFLSVLIGTLKVHEPAGMVCWHAC